MAIKPLQKKKTESSVGHKKKKNGGGWSIDPWALQMAQAYYFKGLSKGKGKGSKGKGGGKGGKGVKKPLNKFQEKLKKIDSKNLVWVGGLSKKTTWKALEKHFAEIKKPTVSDIMKKGDKITAIVAYKSEEDVSEIVGALNGSELDGAVLEVDKWEKSEKPEGEQKKSKKKKKGGKEAKTKKTKVGKFAKAAKKPIDEKIRAKLKETPDTCKVWIGGLDPKTTWKALEKHFVAVAKPKVTEIMNKGKACVAYENEEDVAAAIAALNGTELDGKTLELDTWVKPERPPKKEKE